MVDPKLLISGRGYDRDGVEIPIKSLVQSTIFKNGPCMLALILTADHVTIQKDTGL